MNTPLLKQVKKLGGISPDKSGLGELHQLGKDFRALGVQGVIWANGKGRGADEMFPDLDPDLQAYCESVSRTNHPLVYALAYELDRLKAHRDRFGKYRPVSIPSHVRDYVETLEAEIATLEARIEALEPDSDTLPDISDYSPECIRQARECLGLTQEQAGQRLGVSWITLNRWEHGKTRPTSPAHLRGLRLMIDEAFDAGLTLAEPAPF